MRRITKSTQFKRDLEKLGASGKYAFEEIEKTIFLLAADTPLPEHLRDHALKGQWRRINARDCHVYPDLLLIYAKEPGELRLLRLDSHSEIFRR